MLRYVKTAFINRIYYVFQAGMIDSLCGKMNTKNWEEFVAYVEFCFCTKQNSK